MESTMKPGCTYSSESLVSMYEEHIHCSDSQEKLTFFNPDDCLVSAETTRSLTPFNKFILVII